MGERQSTWGRNIRGARIRPQLSQGALGQLLDPPVSQATVARWEAGSVTIPDARRFQVADALGIEPALLFPMIRETSS